MTILKNDVSKIFFLSVFSLILFLPFFNKAISSDSPFYIAVARQILKDPLRPFSFQINCSDKNYFGWNVANNPPLISYFLAGIIKVFGEREKVFHLMFFAFTLLSIAGIYVLAKMLNTDPFFTALLLIASPAFFINATDVMLDVPLLAFSLWGIYFVVKERFVGWVLLGLALLIKFTAMINLPIIFAWLLLNKKLKDSLIFFIVPVLFLVVWSVHNKLIYNEIQLFSKSADVGVSFGMVKEIPLLTYIGGSFVFSPSILWVSFQKKRITALIFLIAFIATDLFFNLLGYKIIQSMLLGIFISSAGLFIYMVIGHLKIFYLQKETVFLAAWFFLYIFFFMSVSAIIAVRYLLPVLPAAIMLFVKIAEKVQRSKAILTTAVVAGIILSVCLAHSDYGWANSYRNFSGYIQKKYKNKHIYFTGHLGFQYYMEKNGYEAVDSDKKDYKKGSLLIVPFLPVPQKIHQGVIGELRLIEGKYIFAKNPLRTIGASANAGFHLNMYGILPYSFSTEPTERVIVYEVK